MSNFRIGGIGAEDSSFYVGDLESTEKIGEGASKAGETAAASPTNGAATNENDNVTLQIEDDTMDFSGSDFSQSGAATQAPTTGVETQGQTDGQGFDPNPFLHKGVTE